MAAWVQMAAEVETVHSMLEDITFQMTQMSDEDINNKLAGPIALLKYKQTRAATVCSDEACQIFGGRALTRSGMGQFIEKFQRRCAKSATSDEGMWAGVLPYVLPIDPPRYAVCLEVLYHVLLSVCVALWLPPASRCRPYLEVLKRLWPILPSARQSRRPVLFAWATTRTLQWPGVLTSADCEHFSTFNAPKFQSNDYC